MMCLQAALIACQNEEIRTIEYLLTIRRQSGTDKRSRLSPPTSVSGEHTSVSNPPTCTSLQLPPISLKVRQSTFCNNLKLFPCVSMVFGCGLKCYYILKKVPLFERRYSTICHSSLSNSHSRLHAIVLFFVIGRDPKR